MPWKKGKFLDPSCIAAVQLQHLVCSKTGVPGSSPLKSTKQPPPFQLPGAGLTQSLSLGRVSKTDPDWDNDNPRSAEKERQRVVWNTFWCL